ncbi:PilZ domain-containing protein [Thalassobaculum sp.]|uniref:PilZ domain-containing protein n=1 Tax=Thalassobaculum sp. TaxID=2022740 RepID=UPI0032EDBCAD
MHDRRKTPAGDDGPDHKVEPGFVQTPGDPAQREAAWQDNLLHERRDERRHVRVQVLCKHGKYEGHDFSVSGFAVRGPLQDDSREPQSLHMVFAFKGFRLHLPLTAGLRHTSGAGGTQIAGFEILDMEDQERALLRRLLTAHLAGNLVSLDGVLSSTDGQVARRVRQNPNAVADPSSLARRHGRVRRVVGIGLAAVLICGFAGLAVYDSLFVIRSPFAATTAARIDVHAPGEGRFSGDGLAPGTTVSRDQPLGRIRNVELTADLAMARATLGYNETLIAALSEALENGGSREASDTINASLGQGDQDGGLNLVQILTVEKRLDQLKAQTNLQRAKVKALDTRVRENTLYSPCDCIVHWARGGTGEAWVETGEKVYSLVPRDESELLVEAQIPMAAVPRLSKTQRASIYSPDTGETAWGRVVDLSVEGSRRPRAGFPRWVRQDLSKATLLIAPERPLSGVGVGAPVEVTFSDVSTQFEHWRDRLQAAWATGVEAAGQLATLVEGGAGGRGSESGAADTTLETSDLGRSHDRISRR